ncbi:DUF4177 domain-containing protein [Flavimaricola marinus]|uniref:DUF4177 domain-containing protein n=1 Tax=Flavimaricola marinus TaxID=1819565 RepID=A0A238LE97_9RHOB|nr:DUF4177 domain-containing protein [Flavimaricola marinus]SMY07744.1 hypothetical protein LOM8899_01884 [Flavimaricola marinus]
MAQFEYKVVPAPKRGLKAKGIKGTEAQFANALTTLMNDAAADGWEYQRTDSLPCEERQGLTGRVTVFQNMLVFRRALTVPAEAPAPAPTLAVPVDMPAQTAPAPVIVRDAPAGTAPQLQSPDPRVAETLTRGVDPVPTANPTPVQAPDRSQVAAE